MKASRFVTFVGLAFSALAGAALYASAVLGQGSPGVELTTLTSATQVPLGAPCTVSCFAQLSTVKAFVSGSGGGGAAGPGSFTTLAASSTVSGTGFSTYLASPPAIGGTAAAAGTFTNLTASTGLHGPAPVACGASCSPTGGQLITIAVNSGGTATLPTSSGSGDVIRIRVTITQTSATIKVLLTTTSDVIIGTAIGENAGTAKVFVGNAAANHSIDMPFAGTQPSGGFNGDLITCTDMATGTWACDIVYQAGTTPTTPYSTSTS
jgi:hypothetical protein